ncbi:MAG: PDZ domain-containing protein [Pseudomonadota bacterium]
MIRFTSGLMAALLMAAALLASQSSYSQTKLLRFPDIHDDRIVFTYGGDLWSVPSSGGTAVRLTSHPGLELFAKFSPAGDQIAFTGQYAGSEQVYVMSAIGSEPEQLTWYPSEGPLPPRWGYDHQVYGWTPNGNAVLFRSLRDAWDSSEGRLYTVDVNGGLPVPLTLPVAGAGTFAGSESRIFYSPLARDFRTWKRYRGGWSQDLWLYDGEAGTAQQITDNPYTDRDPMWINGQGYFVSDRGENGKLNLYRYDPASDAISQITFHADWDVRWPGHDADGRIVYEHNGELRIFDTRNGQDTAVSVFVPDDGVNRRPYTAGVGDQIGAAALSPTGSRVLFYARGNLFNAPAEEGIVRSLTNRSTAHDREPAWSPDGQRVAYISDVSGEEALYTMAVDGSGDIETVLADSQTRYYDPVYSPDGEHIALSDKDGNILIVPADGDGDAKTVGNDPSWRNRDYTWSPDGQWLAFSLTQPSGLRALFVYGLDDEQTRQISAGMFSEYQPSFAPGGQHLFFLADREFAPQISMREWNYAANRMTGIYAYALTDDAPNPFAHSDSEEPGILSAESDDDDERDGDSSDGDNSDNGVRIDFDGLAQRIIRVPVEATNYTGLHALDGALMVVEYDAWYYGRGPANQPVLKKYSIEDEEFSTFAEGISGYDFSADGKKILLRRGNSFEITSTSGDGKNGESVSTSGLILDIDPVAEWTTIYDEVWRRFRDHFYVENMHGYNWEALREAYRPWLEHVAHRSDLNYLMGELIGELNVSHAYVSGGDMGLPERHPVALPGARFELDERSGRYQIAQLLQGQNDEARYRSPLTEAGMQVNEGDYLLAINGRSLDADDNPYQLLTGLSGAVEFVLADSADPEDDERRTVVFEPISNETNLYYHQYVTDNLRRVEAASDGRLGYLHIPDMGANGIREFIKWFYGQRDREGLVIDVRSNGGGNVSQMLIERLSRRPLALGYSRTMPNASTYPNQAFNGHMVAILNQNSASDGDIFPYQFRNAGLGPYS